MATKKEEYIPQAFPKEISCVSRVSLKIKDNFYTLEYGETRSIPEGFNYANIDKEREALWNICNDEVDRQAQEVQNLFK